VRQTIVGLHPACAEHTTAILVSATVIASEHKTAARAAVMYAVVLDHIVVLVDRTIAVRLADSVEEFFGKRLNHHPETVYRLGDSVYAENMVEADAD
jgi:hypothetical protein